METFGQCIRAWMQAEDMSVAELTEKLGYRSKTSVFRLIHGKSNYQSCLLFCRKAEKTLNADWKKRFQNALFSEKVGLKRHILLEAVDRGLFPPEREEGPFTASFSAPFDEGTVVVLGCVWEQTFSMLDSWLDSSDRIRAVHYVMRRSLFCSDCLLPGLIARVTRMRYSAVMLDDENFVNMRMSWNEMLWISGNRACIMQFSGEKACWIPLPGGRKQAEEILSFLDGISRVSLYRYDQLQTGSDYITFTEQSYRMERNRKVLIIKPCPGIQMIPLETAKCSFTEFLSVNQGPVSAAKDSLIYTHEKRVNNFFHQKKPIYMIVSRDSVMRFARTGWLDDQFFATRPFTREERIGILNTLQRFAGKDSVHIAFRRGEWPVSAEVYDGYGVVFYPTYSNYNASINDYRELFLPGKDFTDVFFQYAREYPGRDFFGKGPDPAGEIFAELMVTAKWAAE